MILEKAPNSWSGIQEEQGLETETQGGGILRSAWISEDLKVDQGMKTGKQRGKEATLKYMGWIPVGRCVPQKAACLMHAASLPRRRAEARTGSTGLPCNVVGGRGRVPLFIRKPRICHRLIRSRGSGNGSCFLS